MELMIEICDTRYKYDFLLLKPDALSRNTCQTTKNKSCKKLKHLDAYLLHYMVKEFTLSQVYRISFLKMFYESTNVTALKFLRVVLLTTQKDLIDYNW